MRNNIDPYSPCVCGSGKKYRFCCQKRQHNLDSGASMSAGAWEDFEEGQRLHDKGLEYMDRGEYTQAIPWFEKSIEANSTVCSSANNLALCLFITGKLDEAIWVQRQSFADSPLPNPFGLANLSLFLLHLNDEEGAVNAVSVAAAQEAPNPAATIKVCESLARLRRHHDIIKTADGSDFGDDPGVCFFTGVAAANLGNRERAIQDLSCIPIGHHRADMARQYLEYLERGKRPDTIRSDWPYLQSGEFFIKNLLDGKDEDAQKALMSGRHAVDCLEAMLNENPDEMDGPMALLGTCAHPEAVKLLWLIAKGTFGPDQLRLCAATTLAERGEIQSGGEIELFHGGKPMKQQLFSINLNPDFEFCEMPPNIERRYEELILAGREPDADWGVISQGYEELSREAPHFYPLRYNYAIGLIHCERKDEAETILWSLVNEYPEYLFARATLLNILVRDNRMDEAKQLLAETGIPGETHPTAYVVWLMAMASYSEAAGQNAEAFKAIQVAHDLDPDNPNVNKLWERWKDYNEKKDTSAYLKKKRGAVAFMEKLGALAEKFDKRPNRKFKKAGK